MKRLLILICSLLCLSASAQTNSLYILGTPTIYPADYKGIHNGFAVTPIEREKISTQPILIYNIGSNEKQYEITLMYYNYIDRTNNPVMLDMAISSIENLDNIIQAEELLKFKDSDSAYKWMLGQLDNKTKLYIIDTNNFYKSDPALDEPDRMKVFEVRISHQWIPDHILNPGD